MHRPTRAHGAPGRAPRLAAFAALALVLACGTVTRAHAQQVPLDPKSIPQFVEPLPIPSVLNGMTTTPGSPLVVTMSEFQQKLLPNAFYAGLAAPFDAGSYVWGYNHSYPGPTIVATRNVPTHVRYVNDLYNPAGGPLHLQATVPVDQTIHWADPLGTGMSFERYAGPVPAVVHLHGGEVPSAFDGGPDAWWTPGFAYHGPGFVTDTYTYPNAQQGASMFYHDHALGMTRLNVYSGLAGFYILLDPSIEPGNLPGGPADTPQDQYGHSYRIGLALQDRVFDTNGQLVFPSDSDNPDVHPFWTPEFFGDVMLVNGRSWPYLQVEPRRYRFEFLDGSNARFYELRLMNLATGRPGPAFWQTGGDQGLLDAAVKLNDPGVSKPPRLLFAPGERCDVVIDFSGYAGQTLTLVNSAKGPYPRGDAPDPQTTGVVMQFRIGTTVTGGTDPSLDPATAGAIRLVPIERPAIGTPRRELTLNEQPGPDGPLGMYVNNTAWDMPTTESLRVGDTEVWEIVNLTMDSHPIHLHLFQFQLVNRQAFNQRQYLRAYGSPAFGSGPPLPYDSLGAVTGFKLGGNPDVTPFLQGRPSPPDPNETGWKDTFRMNPGEVTRVVVRVAPQDALALAAERGVTLGPGVNLYPFEPWVGMGATDAFGYPGGPGYVWHCHIIDHEDNEMMRRFAVLGPVAVSSLRSAASAPTAEAGVLPALPELRLTSPNPARAGAVTRFALPAPARVELSLFDLAGRDVRALAAGVFTAGEHQVGWSARAGDGRRLACGVYFVRMRCAGVTRTQRVVLLP